MIRDAAAARKAALYGLISCVLYTVLFFSADRLVAWARATHDGDKLFFFAPIVIAFAFSYVHGAFTGYFWEALGLKAANGATSSK
jgi:hypothetical protein